MGVVHALASADRPAAELGALIAHAMVGTFLGILLAYGFISPLASVLRQKSAETTKMMQCVKITLLSNLNGYAPPIAVEFVVRHCIPANVRRLSNWKNMFVR